jgi:uncharacterized protein YjbI with pentapeptide repeats
MPELPAEQSPETFKLLPSEVAERLATPAEMAEYGSLAADRATEERILALLEEQMKEGPGVSDLTEESSEISLAEKSFQELKDGTSDGEVPPDSEVVAGGEVSEVAAEPVSASLASEVRALEFSAEERAERETMIDALPEPRMLRADLLELAEALDQHRLWVETAGREGVRGDFSGANLAGADLTGVNLQSALLQKTNLRGADLSMANLRGTNLVEADLRDCNVLGAEFSGANLMGANLYGTQGLWAGRLGGTNLFDATLPEAVTALDGGKTITQFTQSARRFYLLLMAMCAGACALVLVTKDVRLLLDESAIPLSQFPNVLPLQGFYLGAPLLLTVLYLRLQFLLLRLWGSMGALPAVFPDGRTAEKDGPWYLMGPIRPHLKWSRDPRSPQGLAESVMATLLAYWAVPATLAAIWLRYLVLQDYRGTLLQLFLLMLTIAAACAVPRVVARVLRPGNWTDEPTSQFVHDILNALRIPGAIGFALLLISLGVIRGLPADMTVRQEVARWDPRRWAATAMESLGYRPYADISEEHISGLPANASASTLAVGDSSQNDATGPRLNEINLRFARGFRTAFANARMWRANLEGASLSEADFRGANLRESVLKMAKLDKLRANQANLVSTDASGAVMAGADFRNADLSYANLDGATLSTANFERATLYSVNLRNANLLRADLSHADLRDTKLDGAVLTLAALEETDLSAAKLVGANLSAAQIKGTILLEADLSHADMRGATMTGAILRQARLDGANLAGADMRGALGVEGWQICSAQNWRSAELDADLKLAAEQACGTPAEMAAANPAPPPSAKALASSSTATKAPGKTATKSPANKEN